MTTEKNETIAKKMLERHAKTAENALKDLLSSGDESIRVLLDAERYGVFSGGKRIRPALVLEFCGLFGGKTEAALPFACAVEMVHSYSLIHDDLPCMDDDSLRRGRPTCHKKFGEANALLAGDALLTYAFEVTAKNKYVDDRCSREACAVLAEASGSFGMAGGQTMDLIGETKSYDFETLLTLHRLKTGKLMEASAVLGCLAAGLGAEDAETLAAKKYAAETGLAFQIVDDILDLTGDEKLTGKERGRDLKSGKTTFLKFLSPGDARRYAAQLTETAVGSIAKYEGSEPLCALAHYLLEREF